MSLVLIIQEENKIKDMNLKRYSDFLNIRPINENLDKSKKFLKERSLLSKAAKELGFIDDDLAWKLKEGEKKTILLNDFTPEQQSELRQKLRKMRLTDDEVRSLERDPEFLKLRELLQSNIGYLYNFVYMYYVEMTPFNEIEAMYKDVIEYKSLLDRFKSMPEIGKKFDVNFIDVTLPNDKDHRTNAEILADGLEKLKEYRIVKKIVDTLPRKLKKSYESAPPLLKEQMVDIAKAFEELPEDMTPDGITKKERIWKNFFGEMKLDNDAVLPDGKPNPNFGKKVYKSRLKRFEEMSNPIREFIKAAKAHLDASLSDGYSERLEKIDKCNDKFGIMGCQIIYHEGGIMVVQVNSWAANNFLNSHCNHCIVNYQSYWNSYLGDYNKQYYIYNFNISSMEDLSTIGVTIKPDRSWPGGGCQSMRNNSIGSRFKSILKEWEKEYSLEADLFDILEPMTDEEIKKRERAKLAEREIVIKGITIEQIKQYVTEDGVDINKDKAKALINAVEEDDIEKTKLCLSLGASPNLEQGSGSAIAKAKNLEMIKLLVTYGSDITGEVFSNIMHDSEALEFCLRAGLDPNFGKSLPFRKVTKGSWKSKDDMGEDYFEAFKLLLKYGGKIINETGRNSLLKWACEYNRIRILEHAKEEGYFENLPPYYDSQTQQNMSQYEEAIRWMSHARRIDEKSKKEMIDWLTKEHEQWEANMPEGWRERK